MLEGRMKQCKETLRYAQIQAVLPLDSHYQIENGDNADR